MTRELGVVQGTLELIVLQTLAAGAPMHGFAILERIRDTTDDVLVVEDGALYPSLRRMEKRGWLESEWGISDKGRRARYYRLTASGRRALTEQASRWERYVEAIAKLAADAV